MIETKILDGKEAARVVRERVKERVKTAQLAGLPTPKLAVIIVGENPASQTYVRNKEKACGWVGIESQIIAMPADTTEDALSERIRALNADESVNGILVQLPLPKGLNEQLVTDLIAPEKDVDGFHPVNLGRMFRGDHGEFVSCTSAGIIELLKQNDIEICGKHVVICGRSNIAGKPLAMLFLQENATVTVCHSRTQDLKEITKQADILVAAIGKAKFFDADCIKEGAVVVDVGINRTEDGALCGDVDTQSCMGKASAITPVPGGVGPMTVAMLMKNCMDGYEAKYVTGEKL